MNQQTGCVFFITCILWNFPMYMGLISRLGPAATLWIHKAFGNRFGKPKTIGMRGGYWKSQFKVLG